MSLNFVHEVYVGAQSSVLRRRSTSGVGRASAKLRYPENILGGSGDLEHMRCNAGLDPELSSLR